MHFLQLLQNAKLELQVSDNYYFFNRQEKASLLGFDNYAFLSLDSKMADSPSEVWEMISNLKDKSKTAAQTELVTLQVKINCYFITEWYCHVIIIT